MPTSTSSTTAIEAKDQLKQWFCIGTSGATVDGREIKPSWLEEASADYSPETYGARINIEHIRGIMPGSDFSGYGDVAALKIEKEGDTTKLYAQINPTEKLIALNQNREKIYSSMELMTNFAGRGRAYLVGLAVTDSPSSIGTSALQFNADSPFTIKPNFFISEYTEMSAKNEAATEVKTQTTATEDKAAVSLFAKLFEKFTAKETQQEPVLEDIEALREQTQQGFNASAEAMSELQAQTSQQFTDLNNKLDAIAKQLSEQPSSKEQELHTGADHKLQYKQADY